MTCVKVLMVCTIWFVLHFPEVELSADFCFYEYAANSSESPYWDEDGFKRNGVSGYKKVASVLYPENLQRSLVAS